MFVVFSWKINSNAIFETRNWCSKYYQNNWRKKLRWIDRRKCTAKSQKIYLKKENKEKVCHNILMALSIWSNNTIYFFFLPYRKIVKPTANSKQATTISGSNFHTCLINRKCTKKFETIDALIAHCAMDHKRFHCSHCPNIRLFADLYKHLRDVHGIIENAICEHCGLAFGCNRTLQEHIKRKHTVSEPVQCEHLLIFRFDDSVFSFTQSIIIGDICKEWFKSRETIGSHMRYVHIQGENITYGKCIAWITEKYVFFFQDHKPAEYAEKSQPIEKHYEVI